MTNQPTSFFVLRIVAVKKYFGSQGGGRSAKSNSAWEREEGGSRQPVNSLLTVFIWEQPLHHWMRRYCTTCSTDYPFRIQIKESHAFNLHVTTRKYAVCHSGVLLNRSDKKVDSRFDCKPNKFAHMRPCKILCTYDCHLGSILEYH